MAKAYQSGDTTACYSVSVSTCKGLTPASLAMQCYAFTGTQQAKSMRHIFRRNITPIRIKSFSFERSCHFGMYTYTDAAAQIQYAFATSSFTDNHSLISLIPKHANILRNDKPVLQVKY
jgi:hypothetical protein